jgi:hypothetical protein
MIHARRSKVRLHVILCLGDEATPVEPTQRRTMQVQVQARGRRGGGDNSECRG